MLRDIRGDVAISRRQEAVSADEGLNEALGVTSILSPESASRRRIVLVCVWLRSKKLSMRNDLADKEIGISDAIILVQRYSCIDIQNGTFGALLGERGNRQIFDNRF